MMQPVESNPISDSNDSQGNILTDKSLRSNFWTHLADSISHRRSQGLYRQHVVSKPIGPSTIERDGRILTNFGSNDYLGLSWHPSLFAREEHIGSRYGSGASPLVTGYSQAHADLAAAIAKFEADEDALVFSSGFAANLGTVSAVATSEDVVFSDRLNHASLIDGCRLSKARVFVYGHCDMDDLRRLVHQHRSLGRFAFVVTDSIFSMDGDAAPLREIETLCQEYDMMCVLDEAHATGVYGQHGRGLAEHLAVESDRWIRVGTLSKAVGCVGGFVSGSRPLIDWLANHSRSWIYSTAATIPSATIALQAISLIPQMQEQRRSLAIASTDLRARLQSVGFQVGKGDSPIIPIYFSSVAEVTNASERLLASGLFVPAIRPPTVPIGGSLLRVSLSALHTGQELDQLANALSQL
ncbi:MAG: aminotransferase class I/II-fold pyridoxal phosphate-dependent enzyme [Pirellula sp.]